MDSHLRREFGQKVNGAGLPSIPIGFSLKLAKSVRTLRKIARIHTHGIWHPHRTSRGGISPYIPADGDFENALPSPLNIVVISHRPRVIWSLARASSRQARMDACGRTAGEIAPLHRGMAVRVRQGGGVIEVGLWARRKEDRRRRPVHTADRVEKQNGFPMARRWAGTPVTAVTLGFGTGHGNLFAKQVDFPRCRKKGRSGSFRYSDPEPIRFGQFNNHLFLPKLVWLHGLNRGDVSGRVKNVPINASNGQWSVSIQTEQKVEETIPQGKPIGIDRKAPRFACKVSGLLRPPAAGTHRTGSMPCLGASEIPGFQAGEDCNA